MLKKSKYGPPILYVNSPFKRQSNKRSLFKKGNEKKNNEKERTIFITGHCKIRLTVPDPRQTLAAYVPMRRSWRLSNIFSVTEQPLVG